MRHLLNAFYLLAALSCSTVLAADALPEMPVHFIILTKNPKAAAVATKAQMEKEVEILNKHFVTEAGEPLIHFKLKNVVLPEDWAASTCELVQFADAPKEWDIPKRLGLCKDPKIVDPKAIIFVAFDFWSKKNQFKDDTSQGGRWGSGLPFVAIDYVRLNHKTQSPEEHEMGHAFGLSHICVPGQKNSEPSNIMTSSGGCKGGAGLRTIGFNAAQVATIKTRITAYQKKMGL